MEEYRGTQCSEDGVQRPPDVRDRPEVKADLVATMSCVAIGRIIRRRMEPRNLSVTSECPRIGICPVPPYQRSNIQRVQQCKVGT
jgi:hypothetical protein